MLGPVNLIDVVEPEQIGLAPLIAIVAIGFDRIVNVKFWAIDAVQFDVALVVVILVICNVWPLFAAVRFAEVKLAAPEPFATPVTAVCATPFMV